MCHDSWEVPESQMTGIESQHESGQNRGKGRDRQVVRQTERKEIRKSKHRFKSN